jgi:hypothetical protein
MTGEKKKLRINAEMERINLRTDGKGETMKRRWGWFAVIACLSLALGSQSAGPQLFTAELNKLYPGDMEVWYGKDNVTLKLGMRREEVVKLVGEDLERKRLSDPLKFDIGFGYLDDRVRKITIMNYGDQPLAPVKTFRGVKLGDSYVTVRAAYPADRAYTTNDSEFLRTNSSLLMLYYDLKTGYLISDEEFEQGIGGWYKNEKGEVVSRDEEIFCIQFLFNSGYQLNQIVIGIYKDIKRIMF